VAGLLVASVPLGRRQRYRANVPSLREQLVQASVGRDRVVDATKALALALVVVGHGLAWTLTPAGITTTLDVVPWAFWLTWILQILPLFFLMAGRGLTRLTGAPARVARVTRLAAPALPLLLLVLVLAAAVGPFVSSDVAGAAGLLPVQLVWFLGVYLLVIAVSPAIVRIRGVWPFALWLGLIAVVDVLRIHVAEPLGWANLLLVWALFAGLGVHLDRLHRVPPVVLGLGALMAVAAAVTLVALGPYSKALITTAATPGMTNLAPPTLVLACTGIAQVCLLLLVWPLLARALQRDGVWVVVALFASRAMSLYLWHMLAFTLAIGAILALGWAPEVLGPLWWLQHLAVLVLVAAVVLALAPVLERVSRVLAAALGRHSPVRPPTALWSSTMVLVLAAASLLLVSESGLGRPLEVRWVIGIPYVPVVAVAVLVACVAVVRGRAPEPSARPRR
jgi:hypothetical protein